MRLACRCARRRRGAGDGTQADIPRWLDEITARSTGRGTIGGLPAMGAMLAAARA